MKIGIVIPVFNQFKKAVDAISSIKTDETYEVKIIPQYIVNRPLSAAWNEGVAWSKGRGHDFTLVINDDIMFSPQCIDNLITAFVDQEKDGVVMVTGCNVHSFLDDPYLILDYANSLIDYTEHPDFSCFMIRPDIVSTVGLFDENFAPAYYEDNDYHYRIALAGKKALNIASAPYYHYGSATQNSLVEVIDIFPAISGDNEGYYISKWGGSPGKESFQHPYNDVSYSHCDWRPVAK